MGLGKTLQVLTLIWTLLKQGPQVGAAGGGQQLPPGSHAVLPARPAACSGCQR